MYSLDTLEFGKVLSILSGYAISDIGRKKILGLTPEDSPDNISLKYKILREASILDSKGISIAPQYVYDIYPYLKRSKIDNSYLEPEELGEIGRNIRAFILLRKTLLPFSRDYPLIVNVFKNVTPPIDLLNRIEKSIDEFGNLRDDASERLMEINNSVKSLKYQIEKILQNYFTSSETKDYIQEPRITIKNDRYVIPIKSTYRNKVKGVIHAHSGSDQTVFIEPFSITEKNNEIKLLEKEREKEIRRILQRCTAEVGEKSNLLKLIQDVLVDADILQAKIRFKKDYSAIFPEFSDKREILIKGARHPLIKDKVVPVDFRVEYGKKAVVVTGPNTGGKTVLLKTIGLFVIMAQTAIPVPADDFKTMIFDSVYAEIGDEQSIEQSLSTFSAHIKNIRGIIKVAGKRDLILIDELGAGTDPIEGGAIGVAILEYLRDRDILTIVTTHLSMIKMYALEHEDVLVASVQFDSVTLKPTYHVIMGIPGRSNAIEVAEMLGLQREIIDKAKIYMGEDERNFDNVLKRLSEIEMDLTRRESDLRKREQEISYKTEDYKERVEKLTEREIFFRENYRREVSNLLSEYRKKLERSILQVVKNKANREIITQARNSLKEVENSLKEYEQKLFSNSNLEQKDIKLTVGDTVKIRSGSGKVLKGTVIEVDEDRVTVRMGLIKMVVKREDIIGKVNDGIDDKVKQSFDYEVEADNVAFVCDIRGMRYDRAMDEVRRFLDRALLKNLDKVTIIHGLGTGALRKGVWDYLRACNFVSKYYYAKPEEGGFGCTIVELKH